MRRFRHRCIKRRTFEQPGAEEIGTYDYSRSGNPTRKVLEDLLAELEGGTRAFAFASGMAAVNAVAKLASAGEAIVAGDDLYGGSYRLLAAAAERQGIEVRWVDTTDVAQLAEALDDRVAVVLLETPSNPLMKISDIEHVSRLAHQHGALLAVDNSIMSPVLPEAAGARRRHRHRVGNQGSFGGTRISPEVSSRSRTMPSPSACTGPRTPRAQRSARSNRGCCCARSRTLSVRVDRQLGNARAVAEYLRAHEGVRTVYWPGFEDHPGSELHRHQGGGGCMVMSFETHDEAVGKHVVDNTRLFSIAVSFGGVGSVISLPCQISHAAIPPEVRAARALPEGLVRLSVGLEDADDLIRDLERAFTSARVKEKELCDSVPP